MIFIVVVVVVWVRGEGLPFDATILTCKILGFWWMSLFLFFFFLFTYVSE